MLETSDTSRKIIHIDMDAFFAAIEQRDNPDLKGKPIAVGGAEDRGVITTASYEARPFGVGSAMSGKVARKKCPNLIFVPVRFEVYRQVSAQIRTIFARYTDVIEPLSLDEAFLDVTKNKINEPSAIRIAQLIQADILAETNLTASAGVAGSKFLAKVASDIKKPNGLTFVLPEDAKSFIAALPIRKFFGVGPKTTLKMEALGIFSGADLQQWSREDLVKHFGKAGIGYYNVAQNQDQRPVQTNRERKSRGVEHTFNFDLERPADLQTALEKLKHELWERMQEKEQGRTLTLKVKFKDFKQITRSISGSPIARFEDLSFRTDALWKQQHFTQPIRLLGLSVSNFKTVANKVAENQLSLF